MSFKSSIPSLSDQTLGILGLWNLCKDAKRTTTTLFYGYVNVLSGGAGVIIKMIISKSLRRYRLLRDPPTKYFVSQNWLVVQLEFPL